MAGRKKILLLEDDQSLQNVLTVWLKDSYDIEAFVHPDLAFELACDEAEKERPFALFILDVMLKHEPPRKSEMVNWRHHDAPLSHGIAFGRNIRKNPAYKETPIIFLSAALKSEANREDLSRKVDAICYQKPFKYQDLAATIKDILGKEEPNYWRKLSQWVGF